MTVMRVYRSADLIVGSRWLKSAYCPNRRWSLEHVLPLTTATRPVMNFLMLGRNAQQIMQMTPKGMVVYQTFVRAFE